VRRLSAARERNGVRRGHVLALSCVAAVGLTLVVGCYDNSEVNQLAIVSASGFDLVHPDDPHSNILASMQIARPSQLQGGPEQSGLGGGGENTFVVESGAGRTPRAAMAVIQRDVARKFFLDDRRVIVCGDAYARRGIADLVDEATRNPESYLRAYVIVAHRARAVDILRLSSPLNRLPSDAIFELMQSGQSASTNVMQFATMLLGESDPYTMSISMLPRRLSSTALTFFINGVAVFRKSHLVGFLNRRESVGFYWIMPYQRTEILVESVKLPHRSGYITSNLIAHRVQVQAYFLRGRPRIHISLKVDDDIMENASGLDLSTVSGVHEAEAAIALDIKQEIRACLRALQQKYDADCTGFAGRLYQADPRAFARMRPRWRQIYRHLPVALTIVVHVRREGEVEGRMETSGSGHTGTRR